MAGRFFTAARSLGTGVPSITAFIAAPGQTFIRGAAVVVNAAGLLVECGADPTSIAGFAAAAAGSAPGYQAANNPTVVTNREDLVSVYMGEAATIFSCRGVNGGTDPVTPTQTMVGESYGLAKDASGTWVLDLAEVTVKTCTIVDIDVSGKIFFVKLVAANYQFNVAA